MAAPSNFKYFRQSVCKHLITNRYVKIVVLPVIVLMVISNWAEMEIKQSAKRILPCFIKLDSNIFQQTLAYYILYSLIHYSFAWFYCYVFRRELFTIKALITRGYAEAHLQASYQEYSMYDTDTLSSTVKRQSSGMEKLLDLFVNSFLYSIIFFVFSLYNINKSLGSKFFFAFLILLIVLISTIVLSFPSFHSKKTRLSKTRNASSSKLVDILRNFAIIKSFSMEEDELNEYSKVMSHHTKAGKDYAGYTITFSFFFRLLMLGVAISVYVCCFYNKVLPNASFQDILLFQTFFADFKRRMTKIKTICFDFTECYSNITSSELRSTRVSNGAPMVQIVPPSVIEFKEVKILQGESPIFEDLNLVVKSGEKIALTGANGAGKSTILNAMLGFCKYEGHVLFDDVQISNINEKALLKLISYVPQEPHIINSTVWENLVYASDSSQEDAVTKICMEFGMHECFKRMKDGYQTKTGECGRYLSGGQCQLLSFMRAVIKDAPIFILDEPSANLDFAASQALLDIIFTKLRTKTVFLSTHNPYHLARFDKIVHIENGKAAVYTDPAKFIALAKLDTHLE